MANVCISLRLGFPFAGRFSEWHFISRTLRKPAIFWTWAYPLDLDGFVVGCNRAQALESRGPDFEFWLSVSDLRFDLELVD